MSAARGQGVTNWKVGGTRAGDRIRLEAREHDGTHPDLAVVRSRHWEGEVTRDRIEGRLWMVIEGVDRPPAHRPWTAKRSG